MGHLMLCATMWDKVSPEEGDDRFEELRETDVWKEMIANGASTSLISSIGPTAKVKAERIIGELIRNVKPIELAIQDEMIAQGRTVAQTGAGRFLTEYLRETQQEVEQEMQDIYESKLRENAASEEKAKEALLAQEREVERLKRLTEEQTRAPQNNAEQLRQERERERDVEEIHRGGTTNPEKSGEGICAQDTEGEGKAETYADLQTELENAERKMREMRERFSAEIEANAAKLEEAVSTQRREIEELKRQNEKIRQDQSSFPWWKVASAVFAGGCLGIGGMAIGGLALGGLAGGELAVAAVAAGQIGMRVVGKIAITSLL